MEIKVGSVVFSKSGRDAGRFLAVIGFQEDRVLLCDGKQRPLVRPKAKNIRHISATKTVLTEKEMATDCSLRKALAKFAEKESKL